MRLHIVLALAAVAGLTACAKAAAPTPKTDDEKALYSLGVAAGRDFQPFTFSEQELALVTAGLADGARDKSKLQPEEMEKVLPKLQELYKARMEQATKKEKDTGAAFLAKAATEKDATKTASGLVYKTVKAGLADGALDKSKLQPEEMEKVLPKLQELYKTRMEAGTKREKDTGAAFLAKAATEKDATKTASGMVYKTVKAGTGDSPTAADTVKVHYEGRFVDGKVFDSSLKRNEPITFPLGGVIPCWTEGVQLMKVGGKAQLVCPPELAYGDEGRPPQMRGGATLVFDVELLEIVKPEAVDAPAAAAPPATK